MAQQKKTPTPAYTYAMHGVTMGFSIELTAHGRRNVPLFFVSTRQDAVAACAELNALAKARGEA